MSKTLRRCSCAVSITLAREQLDKLVLLTAFRPNASFLVRVVDGLLVVLLSTNSLASEIILYDSQLPGLVGEQGWLHVSTPFGEHTVTEQPGVLGTILDTRSPFGNRSGYFSVDPLFGILKHPAMRVMDRELGYSVRFDLQVLHEAHADGSWGDDNGDQIADRAGFSVLALSDDRYGIELGFWSELIWAQDDDWNGPDRLFTQSERAEFDTSQRREYSLLVTHDDYLLYSSCAGPVLQGRLRNYTAFEGTLDPYEVSNFLFFGDNTTRAESMVELDGIRVAIHDFDADGTLTVADIQLLDVAVRAASDEPSFDLNGDGRLDQQDRAAWIHRVWRTSFGDADLDGRFDNNDVVAVFVAGEYNDGYSMNSSWQTGDWNGDGEFDNEDFVLAFVDGGYQVSAMIHSVPEPSSMMISALSGLALRFCCRRRG